MNIPLWLIARGKIKKGETLLEEELMKFINKELSLDMNGTTEDDWRRLLNDCSLLGFDLNRAAQHWWGERIKEEPFIEYEQQNIRGPHKNGGWELQFRYLGRDGTCGIHSVRNPQYENKNRKSVSYLELKQKAEPTPEFDIDIYI